MLGGPSLQRTLAKTRHRAQPQPFRATVGTHLGRSHKGRLAHGTAPALAPAGLAAQIGVIDFHDAAQRLAVVPLAHRLHEFVLQHPSRVVAHPQLALEVHRRDAVLGLAEQVDGQEPSGQGQLGVVEQRAGGERGLMLATDAREDLAPAELAALVVAAVGAAVALGPARGKHGLFALCDSFVASEELRQALAFLKLDPVLRYR